MSEPWIRDPRPVEQIHAEFWAEQRRVRERREEIAAMPRVVALEAMLADGWSSPALLRVLFSQSLFLRNPANGLDEWLAEDGRVDQVYERLGLPTPQSLPLLPDPEVIE